MILQKLLNSNGLTINQSQKIRRLWDATQLLYTCLMILFYRLRNCIFELEIYQVRYDFSFCESLFILKQRYSVLFLLGLAHRLFSQCFGFLQNCFKLINFLLMLAFLSSESDDQLLYLKFQNFILVLIILILFLNQLQFILFVLKALNQFLAVQPIYVVILLVCLCLSCCVIGSKFIKIYVNKLKIFFYLQKYSVKNRHVRITVILHEIVKEIINLIKKNCQFLCSSRLCRHDCSIFTQYLLLNLLIPLCDCLTQTLKLLFEFGTPQSEKANYGCKGRKLLRHSNYNNNSYSITIIFNMQSSKSIKLQVTNNQAHISLAKCNIEQMNSHIEEQQLIEFQQSQLDSEDNNQKIIPQSLRSMFTIRQEDSYEYDSQVSTPCIKVSQCKSILADLSTIKAPKELLIHNVSNDCKAKSNQNNCGKDTVDIQTMVSFVEKELALNQPQIQSWEQKIKEQNSQAPTEQPDEEKIQEEQFFVLKPSERKLYLNKSKIKFPQNFELKFNNQSKQNNHAHMIRKLKLTIVKKCPMESIYKINCLASAKKVR